MGTWSLTGLSKLGNEQERRCLGLKISVWSTTFFKLPRLIQAVSGSMVKNLGDMNLKHLRFSDCCTCVNMPPHGMQLHALHFACYGDPPRSPWALKPKVIIDYVFACERILYEPLSKPLVSPLITLIVLPSIIPYITPL